MYTQGCEDVYECIVDELKDLLNGESTAKVVQRIRIYYANGGQLMANIYYTEGTKNRLSWILWDDANITAFLPYVNANTLIEDTRVR